MTAQSRPFGGRILKYYNGAAYDGSVISFYKTANVIIAPGDPVVVTGSFDSATGLPLVTRATGTEGTPSSITGWVVTIAPLITDLSKTYLAAADSGTLFVATNPELVVALQSNATLATTTALKGCNLIVTNANTNIGLSQVQLDAANVTIGTQMKLLYPLAQTNNALDDAYPWMACMTNESSYNPGVF